MDAPLPNHWQAGLEVAGFYGLILTAIWFGPPGASIWLGALGLLVFCGWSNWRHKDNLEVVGLASKNFLPCLLWTLRLFAVPLLLLAIVAAQKPAPDPHRLVFAVLGYPLWAFAQEYALLAFCANRLRDILGPKPWTVAVVNGALFALVHIPNPYLMVFCFFGGVVFTWIFQKARHLVPIALAHATAAFLISLVFQHLYNILMIGPNYLKYLGVPGPPP